jgi:hypothetical protein
VLGRSIGSWRLDLVSLDRFTQGKLKVLELVFRKRLRSPWLVLGLVRPSAALLERSWAKPIWTVSKAEHSRWTPSRYLRFSRAVMGVESGGKGTEILRFGSNRTDLR